MLIFIKTINRTKTQQGYLYINLVHGNNLSFFDFVQEGYTQQY